MKTSSIQEEGRSHDHTCPWWDEFEKQLTSAFNAYVKKEKRQVLHSNEMKLRILLSKVSADFLKATKATLGIELVAKYPMTMAYETTLASFRNTVNQKHPPQMKSGSKKARRDVSEIQAGRNRGGRFHNSGRGRGGRNGGRSRGGGGGSSNQKRKRFRMCLIVLLLVVPLPAGD